MVTCTICNLARDRENKGTQNVEKINLLTVCNLKTVLHNRKRSNCNYNCILVYHFVHAKNMETKVERKRAMNGMLMARKHL